MAFNPIWFLVFAVIFYLAYDLLYRMNAIKELREIHTALEDMLAYQREMLNEAKKK